MPRAATATKPKPRKQRESWGQVETLPSGRVRTRYTGPDLVVHKPEAPFETMLDARAWLADERRLIDSGKWTPPGMRNQILEAENITLAAYAGSWLEQRTLAPRTYDLYRGLLDQKILPPLGDKPVKLITPPMVKKWYASLPASAPTRRAHAYGLLRTIMGDVVRDEYRETNPCNIYGGSVTKRVRAIKPATADELRLILERIADRYMLFVLLGVWCALRFGELIELRVKDVDLEAGVLHITRAAGKVKDKANPGHMVWVVGPPKSEAGVRDLAIPDFLIPAIRDHIAATCLRGKEALIFPAAESNGTKRIEHGGFHKMWGKARDAAKRPDLRIHDLRHTGATLYAQQGATIKDLMARIGHSTPNMAMRYQHASRERDEMLTAKLNAVHASGTY